MERGVAECSRLEQAHARRREQLARTHERMRANLLVHRDQVNICYFTLYPGKVKQGRQRERIVKTLRFPLLSNFKTLRVE